MGYRYFWQQKTDQPMTGWDALPVSFISLGKIIIMKYYLRLLMIIFLVYNRFIMVVVCKRIFHYDAWGHQG